MSKSGVKKIAILGFAREGAAILKFLQNRGYTRMQTQKNADKRGCDIRANQRNNRRRSASKEIWILDKNPKIKTPAGLKKQTGKNYLKNINQFDIVFRSPGIPYGLPELAVARKKGVRFGSGTKIFFEEARKIGATIIGITGTKGKGTTCTLLYKILKSAGKQVFLAGNIGKPAIGLLPQLPVLGRHKSVYSPYRSVFVILELSSFQLQDMDASPRIAAVLDTFPDHQDSHANLAEYYAAKTNIARYQSSRDKIFFFTDNKKSAEIAAKSRGKKIGVIPQKFGLFSPADIKTPGYHNFKNAAMAATIALSFGISKKIILDAVKKFRGTEHRLEFVRHICDPNLRIHPNDTNKKIRSIRVNSDFSDRCVDFYNDSASTNPHTAATAIRAFSSPSHNLNPKPYNLILIAGGKDKNLDYSPMARALKDAGQQIGLVVLMGENRKKIAAAIRKTSAPIKFAVDLKTAVRMAYDYSKLHAPMPTGRQANSKFYTIVFSSGAASFDMFQNYADRGKQFKKLVRRLK